MMAENINVKRIDEDALENVSGGSEMVGGGLPVCCPNCGEIFTIDSPKKNVVCPNCKKSMEING